MVSVAAFANRSPEGAKSTPATKPPDTGTAVALPIGVIVMAVVTCNADGGTVSVYFTPPTDVTLIDPPSGNTFPTLTPRA